MRTEKKIPEKKANQLPLASMSSNWTGGNGAMKKSGKHNSQEVIARNRKHRKRKFNSSKPK